MTDRSRTAITVFAIATAALICLTAYWVIFRASHSHEHQPDASMAGESFWRGRQAFRVASNGFAPAQLPGPLDGWAGSEQKEIILETPSGHIAGAVRVRITFLDSHESAPPEISLFAGGKLAATAKVEAGNGSSNAEWESKGRPSSVTMVASNRLFAGGVKEISLRSIGGSWAAIGAIEVEELAPAWLRWAVKIGWIAIVLAYAGYATALKKWEAHTAMLGGAFMDAVNNVKNAPASPSAVAWTVFLLVIMFFARVREDIIPFNAEGLRKIHGIIGDEPEYFIAAYSLAHDGDMDVSDNARNGDWKLFNGYDCWKSYHGSLAYFQRVSPVMKKLPPDSWGGAQLLVHRPGLSVLISPAALSRERLRWWSYFIISTTAALGMAAAVYLLAGAGVYPAVAGGIVITTALAPPSLFYMNQAFPEIPASVLACLAVASLMKPSLGRVIMASVICAVLPWFSDRGAPVAFFIGLACLILAPGNKGKAMTLAILAGGAALLAQYYYHRFGVPYPVDHHTYFHASLLTIPEGLPRVILDRARGFIWLAPALALAPAAFYFWWKTSKRKALALCAAAAFVSSVLAVSSHPDWTGGGCATGRYAVMFQWLAVPAFAMWARAGMSVAQKALLAVLLMFGVIEGLLIYRPSGWMYSKFHPLFQYKAIQPYYWWLPDMQEYTGGALWLAAGWSVLFAICVATAFMLAPERNTKPDGVVPSQSA